MPSSVHCRPEAFHLFSSQVSHLETTEGLLHAAVAISRHELNGPPPEAVLARLHALGDRVVARVRGHSVQVLLAHLHDVLFEEEHFTGNVDDYYNPFNSYLPKVLETHLGIPITLTLIYKVVGERVGLHIEGVNAPGHFLAKVKVDNGTMLIDPYSAGRLITQEEALARIEEVTGRRATSPRSALPRATHAQWIARMIANLHNIFATQNRREDVAAMVELQSLLGPVSR
jgi:regulator of sirC expression with transglutaminase-like and TPR domain